MLFDASFTGLTADRVMAPSELNAVKGRLFELFRYHVPAKQAEEREWLEKRAQDEALVKEARQRLIKDGLPRDRVARFPALQAVLLDIKSQARMYREDQIKWMMLPYPQAQKALTSLDRHSPFAGTPVEDLVTFRGLVVLRAQTRLQQRLAMLRHVEAIRLYAAAHEGKLPAHLNEIEVPLPDDPFTGKPFHYDVEGETATLRGTPPAGMEKAAPYNIIYQSAIQH
jgi:hypothetical protein